ncbi:hypothetical protein GCM10010371_51450 [Streptomyces subrutilus]|uniref:Uncharacterized protein n=1 Tax=Streptomyces subrutilus TaxID=36818 RepID=A0A918R4U2_9ACTN|nr:hypothetical protein GCM10010371_51450 [Streptomyces subrutilus]
MPSRSLLLTLPSLLTVQMWFDNAEQYRSMPTFCMVGLLFAAMRPGTPPADSPTQNAVRHMGQAHRGRVRPVTLTACTLDAEGVQSRQPSHPRELNHGLVAESAR